jgi:GNAT superfamily N-acetyltransferase
MSRSMESLEKSSRRPELGSRKTGTPAIFIRKWVPVDGGQLWQLIYDYLKETYEAGYDVPPTGQNVLVMLNMGMVAVQEGDPVIVAEAVGELLGKVIGWTFWKSAGNGILTRGRTLVGMGTYVVPYMRRHGVARQMHEEAIKVARAGGYECVDRVTVPGTPGEQMLEGGGWKPVATVFRKELICTEP